MDNKGFAEIQTDIATWDYKAAFEPGHFHEQILQLLVFCLELLGQLLFLSNEINIVASMSDDADVD